MGSVTIYPPLGTSTGVLNETPSATIQGTSLTNDETGFIYPNGIAVDSKANIYVTNPEGRSGPWTASTSTQREAKGTWRPAPRSPAPAPGSVYHRGSRSRGMPDLSAAPARHPQRSHTNQEAEAVKAGDARAKTWIPGPWFCWIAFGEKESKMRGGTRGLRSNTRAAAAAAAISLFLVFPLRAISARAQPTALGAAHVVALPARISPDVPAAQPTPTCTGGPQSTTSCNFGDVVLPPTPIPLPVNYYICGAQSGYTVKIRSIDSKATRPILKSRPMDAKVTLSTQASPARARGCSRRSTAR